MDFSYFCIFRKNTLSTFFPSGFYNEIIPSNIVKIWIKYNKKIELFCSFKMAIKVSYVAWFYLKFRYLERMKSWLSNPVTFKIIHSLYQSGASKIWWHVQIPFTNYECGLLIGCRNLGPVPAGILKHMGAVSQNTRWLVYTNCVWGDLN